MTMFPSAFIVNIEKDDSVHFNQVGGKRMRGYFKDNKLNKMDIFGNAESIYFSRDSGKTTVSGMERSLSSRIHVDFKDNKVTNLGFYTKPQDTYAPLNKVKEDDKILKGFIWKPKERPVSKESIIPSYNKKRQAIKPPDKSKDGKLPLKKPPGLKMTKDSAIKNTIPGKKDSILKNIPAKLSGLGVKKDTGKLPGVKTVKDSVKKMQLN